MTLGQSLPIPEPQFPHLSGRVTIPWNPSGHSGQWPLPHGRLEPQPLWAQVILQMSQHSPCLKPFSSGRYSSSKEQPPLQPPSLSSSSSAGQPPGAWPLATSSMPLAAPMLQFPQALCGLCHTTQFCDLVDGSFSPLPPLGSPKLRLWPRGTQFHTHTHT